MPVLLIAVILVKGEPVKPKPVVLMPILSMKVLWFEFPVRRIPIEEALEPLLLMRVL